MKNKYKILFRKELREFIFNYKSWLTVLLVTSATYIPQVKRIDNSFIIMILLMMLGIMQYSFDSYSNDQLFKGSLFLHNIKATYFDIFCIKLVFSFFMGLIMVFISLPNFDKAVSLVILLWLIPCFVFSSAIVQLTAVFTKGTETVSAVFTIVIICLVIIFLFNINSLTLQIFVILALTGMTLFVGNHISKSLLYRSQL